MNLLVTLLGCGSAPAPVRPPDLLPEAVAIGLIDGQITVDATPVGPQSELEQAPSRPFAPLVESLAGRHDVWVGVPRDTPWSTARVVVASSLQAGSTLWLGDPHGPTVGPVTNQPRTVAVPSCDDEGVQVVGVGRSLTFGVHLQGTTRWPTARLRFLPQVQHDGRTVSATLLPERCWRGASCDQLEGAAAEACRETTAEPQAHVDLAGPDGCLVPTAKGMDRWREHLPGALEGLGLGADTPTLVMPDATVPYGDVVDLLRGLADHGIRSPGIGLLHMGSAETEPACEGLRTPEEVARAAGAWYGAMLRRNQETPR